MTVSPHRDADRDPDTVLMIGAQPEDRLRMRIDAGDADSLRRLFSRHAPLVVALIAHLVGRSQAQDIVQETFLQLWSRRWHEPDQGSVRSWLFANAHRRAVEMIRRGEALTPEPAADALRTIVETAGVPPRWMDPRTRARRAIVLHALMALPAKERAPIELMYLRGLSRRQIAERLGVPLQEIRVRSTAGLRRLERALRSSGTNGSIPAIVSIPSAEDPCVSIPTLEDSPAREAERVEVFEPRVQLRRA